MANTGITYVVLGSQRPDVGDSVRPFSRLTRMDEPQARRLLSAHGPRLFQAFSRRAEAQGLATQIRALGLQAATITPEDLWEYVYVTVRQLNIGQGGISGSGAPGETPLFIPFSDVAVIVRGEVAGIEVETKNMTDTAIRRRAAIQLGAGATVTVVDVHRFSVPVAMRLRQYEFHMNPVVAGEPVVDAASLDQFIEIVLNRAPQAAFDDGFNRSSEAVDLSLRMLDAGERAVTPPRTVEDEAPPTPTPLPPPPARTETELIEPPAFDLYSALWRFQTLGT